MTCDGEYLELSVAEIFLLDSWAIVDEFYDPSRTLDVVVAGRGKGVIADRKKLKIFSFSSPKKIRP